MGNCATALGLEHNSSFLPPNEGGGDFAPVRCCAILWGRVLHNCRFPPRRAESFEPFLGVLSVSVVHLLVFCSTLYG